MAGSVIQATWTVEIEDGLRTEVQLEVRLDPYSNRSKPIIIAYNLYVASNAMCSLGVLIAS